MLSRRAVAGRGAAAIFDGTGADFGENGVFSQNGAFDGCEISKVIRPECARPAAPLYKRPAQALCRVMESGERAVRFRAGPAAFFCFLQ